MFYFLSIYFSTSIEAGISPQTFKVVAGGSIIQPIVAIIGNADDGKLYIYIGDAGDYYRMIFTLNRTIWHYVDGCVKEYSQDSSIVSLSGTLIAGQTSITFTNSAITTNSTFEFFTDKFGVVPTGATVSSSSIVLTFTAQSSNVGVKVKVT